MYQKSILLSQKPSYLSSHCPFSLPSCKKACILNITLVPYCIQNNPRLFPRYFHYIHDHSRANYISKKTMFYKYTCSNKFEVHVTKWDQGQRKLFLWSHAWDILISLWRCVDTISYFFLNWIIPGRAIWSHMFQIDCMQYDSSVLGHCTL